MILSILFILLITFGIGLPLVLLIAPKANQFIKLGLSYPLGIGIFTILMFGTNLLGLKFTLLNELLLLLFVSTPLLLTQLKKIKSLFKNIKENIKNTKFDLAEKIILGVLAFLIITSFISTFYWPVYMWDSVVLYDFRGHVFASTGFMKDVFINEYYYAYPLLTSLAHTIVYLCGGKYPQFIYSMFYLSLGVSFYGLLREFVARKAGLMFTALLLMTGPLFYHSLFSYTNLTYTVYLSLGAILVYLWNKKGNIRYLILSALLVGLSTWVRATEPFWVALILLVCLISIFRKKPEGFIYALVVFPIRQMWVSYRQYILLGGTVGISNQALFGPVVLEFINLNRWKEVGVFLYKYLITPQWPLVILFVLSGILLILKKQKKHSLMFIITLLFFGVLTAGTFIFSIYLDYWNRIGDAIERLSIVIYPLIVYCVALII